MKLSEKKSRKLYTLVLPVKDGQVLLGYKKRGFGAGKWNGFGGKVGDGENIEEAAARELLEECGLSSRKLVKYAVHEFEFQGEPVILQAHVFRAEGLVGSPMESDEMMPSWFDIEDIPCKKMWPDDIHWLPRFLSGETLIGKFLFKKDVGGQERLIDFEVEASRQF